MFPKNDAGYVIPIDESRYHFLLKYFNTTGEDLPNVITPGDFEFAENIADIRAYRGSALFDRDDLVGDIGIRYIWCEKPDYELGCMLTFLGYSDDPDNELFYDYIELDCIQ